MRIGFFSGMLGGLCLISTLHAQEPDSLKAVSLSEVVVTESYQHLKNKNSTWRMEVVGKSFCVNTSQELDTNSWNTSGSTFHGYRFGLF